MKQFLLLVATTFAFYTHSKAQCPAHVKYTAGKMEMLDSTMTLSGTKEETFTFETREIGFTGIRVEDEGDSLHGVLKSVKCDWKEPYKNGKLVMICDIASNDEDLKDATITIEAIDSKITITMQAKEHPERIVRLIVDKYEEIK